MESQFPIQNQNNKQCTVQEMAFVEYYVKTGNGGKAYMEAFKTDNVKSAHVCAIDKLKEKHIQMYMQAVNEELRTNRIMSAQEIQEELSLIARGIKQEEVLFMKKTYDCLKNEEAFIPQLTYKTVSIKDSLKALELLARIKGMFNDNLIQPIMINISPTYD